jgi:DNA replication licensing factor MCM5
MRGKVRSIDASGKAAKTAIPITVRQLEAIVRISESLAKMTLSPVANESHVDEAIRLFNHSTMSAIQSGSVGNLDRGAFSDEVRKIEDQIRRRLPLGSRISEKHLKEELSKQVFIMY